MQKLLFYMLLSCLLSQTAAAQELYVFSEPASNMPAHALSAKLSYRTPVSKSNNNYRQRYTPEVMFGLNKNWMLHLSSTFSDFYSPQVRWESVKTYAKYRFYSNDEVHRHFRMAAFAEASYASRPSVDPLALTKPLYYGDINLDGDYSGIQAGIIATQLVNKLALSGTASVIKVFAFAAEDKNNLLHAKHAFYYSVSAGYLLFPVNYSDYKQTNLNLYFETIGMKDFEMGDYMFDLAPALQLIFNSNFKVNLGARFQVTANMLRAGENNYFISLERTFLGALKHKKKVS